MEEDRTFDDLLQFFGENTPLKNHPSQSESFRQVACSGRRMFRASTPMKAHNQPTSENLSLQDEMSTLSLNYEESFGTLNRTICLSDLNSLPSFLEFKKPIKRKSYSPIYDELHPVKVTTTSPLSIPLGNKINKSTQMDQSRNARVSYKGDSPGLLRIVQMAQLSSKACTLEGVNRSKQLSSSQFPKDLNQSIYRTPTRPKKKRCLELSPNRTLRSVYKIPIEGLKATNKLNRVTTPQPFSFDERDKEIIKKRYERKFRKGKNSLFEFKAKEPSVLKKSPFRPEIKIRKSCKVVPPNLLTEKRAKMWENMKLKRLERSRHMRKLEEEAQRAAEKDIQKVRRTLEFKATPVRRNK